MPAVKTQIIDQQQRGLREMAVQPPRVKPAPSTHASPAGTLQRTVHDAANTTTLPGKLIRAEGRPASGDAAVDEAYEHQGATYKLFWDIYKRHSIDGQGLPLIGSVHDGEHYDNAFWNGALCDKRLRHDADFAQFAALTLEATPWRWRRPARRHRQGVANRRSPDMIQLPPLDLAQLVRLTREGGLAYLPGLAQPRSIDLATYLPARSGWPGPLAANR